MRDGVVVGVIAYAAVAVFYGIFDFLASREALYTVNLLGRAVFRGLRDRTVLQLPVGLDLTAIFLYNGLHLVLSILIGIVVVQLVGHAQRNPPRAWLMLLLIVSGFVVTILGVGWLTRPIRPVLPWWSIVAANSSAVVLAATFLIHKRPGVLGSVVPFAD